MAEMVKAKLNGEFEIILPKHRADINVKKIRGKALDRLILQLINNNGCWEWTGSLSRSGYARFKDDNGKCVAIHRWTYEHFVGKIPDKFTIDHKCFNTKCCNPQHLQAVSIAENVVKFGKTNAAFINSKKNTCNNGHSLSESNLRIEKAKYGQIRRCKLCHNAKINKWRMKNG